LLRALQNGLSLEDLDYIEYGTLMDILIESANDSCEYATLADQDDFDSF